jgi:hypothetical protein
MIRKILGFVVLAVVALVVLKIALALLGVVIGLSVSLLVFAAMGYGFYLVVRLVSPKTADRIQDMIRGRPAAAP